MSSNGDPFSFFEEEKLPSWYQQLIWDLNEFLVKSFGLDPFVWMGRIVASLLLLFAWDAYWAPVSKNNQKREREREQEREQQTQKQQPTNEKANTVDASESSENPSQPQSLPSSSLQPSKLKNEMETTTSEESIPKETNDATMEEPGAQSSKKIASKIDKPKETATITNNTARSTLSPHFNSDSNSNVNPWDTNLDGFHYWYEIETSLYRIYTLAHRDPSVPTIPPYLANSQRGNVAVEMRVTNRTHRDIHVYWVDYKGKHVPKGTISKQSGAWTQTTWIDHPWVMEDANTGTLLLYFVPYKVIPTLPVAPTVGTDGRTGLFAFDIIESDADTHAENNYWIGISDKVLPYPSSNYFDTPLKAIHWTLQHLSRHSQASRTDCFAVETATLQKYLLNIMNHPDVWKYRNLKISSKHFVEIWNSPLRGLLLAVGFVEDRGYCSLSLCDSPISPDKVQEVALLSYLLSEWTRKASNNNLLLLGEQQQPIGAADGYGRAGFGRAGAMG